MAIVEYAIVLGLARKQKDKKNKNGKQAFEAQIEQETLRLEEIIIQMDKWTMIASAVFFLVFNLAYWIYYANIKINQ